MRVYEINTRVHCQKFDQISEAELAGLSDLGFDAVWLMGVWQISEGSKKISRIVSDDFFGSPFSIPSYKISEALAGSWMCTSEKARRAWRRRSSCWRC